MAAGDDATRQNEMEMRPNWDHSLCLKLTLDRVVGNDRFYMLIGKHVHKRNPAHGNTIFSDCVCGDDIGRTLDLETEEKKKGGWGVNLVLCIWQLSGLIARDLHCFLVV